MKEIETRILDIDVEKIKEILISHNAKMVKMQNQVNKIFDFPDRRLINKKGYARIRMVSDMLLSCEKYYMTVKKLISQEKYKIMDEAEVEILDAEIGEKIFYSLGLELCEIIKKYRETYKYKNTLIEIDINDKSFCPFPYIEIEGSNENEIKEIVRFLGYSMEDTTSDTIYEILKKRNIKGVVDGI